MMVQETSDELVKKKLRLLINKQFFELGKYLGNLYTEMAMQKMIAKE